MTSDLILLLLNKYHFVLDIFLVGTILCLMFTFRISSAPIEHECEIFNDRDLAESALQELSKVKNELAEVNSKMCIMSDELSMRSVWVKRAKEEAGYPETVPFDVVWSDIVQKAKLYEDLSVNSPARNKL